MNNGIFSSFDRRNSSDLKTGYNPAGLIQFEASANSLPLAPLSAHTSIDGIYHLPPAQDWRFCRDRIVYLIDTTRPRYDYRTALLVNDLDKSFRLSGMTSSGDVYGTATVDWGDGVIETFIRRRYDPVPYFTHTYNNHGIYVIQVFWGTDTTTIFDNYSVVSDPNGATVRADERDNKLLAVLAFDVRSTMLRRFFMYYLNCDFVPINIPPSVTSIEGIFQAANGLFKNVELWDTKNITNMSVAFEGFTPTNPNYPSIMRNSIFNSNLSNWNVSNVTNMSSMFANCSVFNNGGSSGIANWDVSKVTNMSYMFGSSWRSTIFNQPIGNWNVSNVTNMAGMFGSSESQAAENGGNKSFNQDISTWNTSKVTNMSNMFFGATSFNNAGASGIGNWDTSACTNMNNMFRAASVFNHNISNWNVSGVTNMSKMFWMASAFNNGGSSGINNWNTSSVTNIEGMFLFATSFNQPIGNWNTSNVTDMFRVFDGATAFNQDIGNWNTSKVTRMTSMFGRQCPANYSLGSWDVSKVTDFTNMFSQNAFFNNGGSNSINNWTINTSGDVTMQNMFFVAQVFNQPIGNWNVSRVINMQQMFNMDFAFNQDISNWNVSKVRTMNGMFDNATAFQGGLSGWNLAGLNATTSLDNFMLNKTGANSYSTANYDNLLIGWNSNKASGVNGVGDWRTDLRPHFGGAKYTAGGAAATARAALVTYGWTITDGGTA